MKTFKFIVSREDVSSRLDVYLTQHTKNDISRNVIKNLIRDGQVSVNTRKVKPSYKVHFHDEVCIKIPEEKKGPLVPMPLPLNIIYEDGDILILDKPAGITVHPGAGNRAQTLVNALLAVTDKLSTLDPQRPGIVHRLDKDTSGLMVLAKNNQAHLDLARQFKKHKVKKIYLAIVEGEVQFDEGMIDVPLFPDRLRRQRMKVDFCSKREAKTFYKVIRRLPRFSTSEKTTGKTSGRKRKDSLTGFTVVELSPITGRTHQLRAHMKYLGHPILGDKIYGSRFPFTRLCLHAKYLMFSHPATGKIMEFNCPIPKEISGFIKIRSNNNL